VVVEEKMKTVDDLMGATRDVFTVRRVFGDPIEKDGITVLPAAYVMGGGGGGGGAGTDPQGKPGEGFGSGFGVYARPAGVFVIKDGEVSWRPAVDPMRPIFAAQAVAMAALMTWRTLAKARRHRG
jgi:uncharacterized spore protein YtfJ